MQREHHGSRLGHSITIILPGSLHRALIGYTMGSQSANYKEEFLLLTHILQQGSSINNERNCVRINDVYCGAALHTLPGCFTA